MSEQRGGYHCDWRCKHCGAVMGRVEIMCGRKVLRYVVVPALVIRGDAEIPCPECGQVKEWRHITDNKKGGG